MDTEEADSLSFDDSADSSSEDVSVLSKGTSPTSKTLQSRQRFLDETRASLASLREQVALLSNATVSAEGASVASALSSPIAVGVSTVIRMAQVCVCLCFAFAFFVFSLRSVRELTTPPPICAGSFCCARKTRPATLLCGV